MERTLQTAIRIGFPKNGLATLETAMRGRALRRYR